MAKRAGGTNDRSTEERDRDERIRAHAYRLWKEEGCPEGRAETHWEKARELVAIEDNYDDTLKPNPIEDFENSPTGEPVEPIEAVRNLGEFPTLTDQGEEEVFPARRLAEQADKKPLKAPRKAPPRSSPRKNKP